MDYSTLKSVLEGMLFVSGEEGITAKTMAEVVEVDVDVVANVLKDLQKDYTKKGRARDAVHHCLPAADHAGRNRGNPRGQSRPGHPYARREGFDRGEGARRRDRASDPVRDDESFSRLLRASEHQEFAGAVGFGRRRRARGAHEAAVRKDRRTATVDGRHGAGAGNHITVQSIA